MIRRYRRRRDKSCSSLLPIGIVAIETIEQIVAITHGIIPRRIAGTVAILQTRDGAIEVHVEEIRAGMTIDTGQVLYAMRSRLPAIVGPPRQHVGDIDDERAGNWRRRDPVATPRPHLQPSHLILGQYRNEAVVRVRRRTERVVRRVMGPRWIVQKAQECRWLAKMLFE